MKKAYHQLPISILFFLILIVGAVYLFSGSMDLYPTYVHAWTQSDRLAIAMKFQENGFDLFHPATYNLLTKEGITQVDFPIHDYLVAVISSIFKWDIISCFRYYNLLYGLLGILFLYRATLKYTYSAAKASLVGLFAASLPFLVYYQNGFLPSIPSFANFCIGLYFWVNYHRYQRVSSGIWAVVFLSLAALSRIPFTIFLLSFLLMEMYRVKIDGKFKPKTLVAGFLGLLAIVAYYLYNQQLSETYGSMFLSELMYPRSFDELLMIFNLGADRWSGQLFSPYHLLVLLGIIGLLIAQRKNKLEQKEQKELLVWLIFSFLGALAYFLLMGRQFIDHDYYFIDSFLPVMILALLYGINKVQIEQKSYALAFSICFIALFGFYASAKEVLEYRYSWEANSKSLYRYEVFRSAKKDLKIWGVEKQDTLAVFDVGSTNIPLTIFQQNGYTSLSSGEEAAKRLLSKPFDHALILDSFKISDSYFDYPLIANNLRFLKSNGKISLYEKNESQDPSQFFRKLIQIEKNDFEAPDQANLRTTNNGHAYFIGKDAEFSLTTPLIITEEITKNDLRLGMKADYLSADSAKGLQFVISLDPYYFSFYLESELEHTKDWESKTFIRRIPKKYLRTGAELKSYFWNPQKSEIYIDNYHQIVYQ